jgi:hypothetical protein
VSKGVSYIFERPHLALDIFIDDSKCVCDIDFRELLTYNAEMIEKQEGKSHDEALYLAACLMIDDLSTRPNGKVGYQRLMEILQSDYPQHVNDIITYVGWSTGILHFKPEYEAEMRARHAK